MKNLAVFLLILIALSSLSLPVFAQSPPEASKAAGSGRERLTLSAAVEAAVRNNPALASTRTALEKYNARVAGEGVQPNPELSAGAYSGDPRDENFSIEQRLLIFGQTGPRREKALRELEEATFLYGEAVLALTMEVRTSYLEALKFRELLSLAEENMKITDSVSSMARKRYDAGDISQVQMQKITLEGIRMENAVVEARRALDVSMATLNTLLGRARAAYPELDKVPIELVDLPETAELKRIALSQRPLLGSAQARIRAADAEVRIARSLGLPEAKVSAYQSDFGATPKARGVAFSISVPLFDLGSIREKVKETRASVQEKKLDLASAESHVLLEVEESALKVKEAGTRLGSFRTTLLSESEDILKKILFGYENGALSYLEVLEAQRTYISVRKDYQETLFGYGEALFSLERAVGAGITAVKKGR